MNILQEEQFDCSNATAIDTDIKAREQESKRAREQIASVDVLLVCYNQELFIEKTLESILSQKTHGFKYRVVVADDASSDNTVEIIRTKAKESNVPFCFLTNDHNYGITLNYKRAFAACTSKYIAVIEGDDLWTDSLRLEKHVAFLEGHPECVMSFNCYDVCNFETGSHHIRPDIKIDTIYTGNDIAYDNLIGNYSTCVYRRDVIQQLPEEMYLWNGVDWITNLMVSRYGKIGCLRDVMNIYRIHSRGIWSSKSEEQKLQELINIIDDYDEKLEYIYHKEFIAHKERLEKQLIYTKTLGYRLKSFLRKVKYVLVHKNK